MSVGGPIQEITLDGRRFAVDGESDGARKLGGYENEFKSNGDGTARQVKTRVPWSVSGLAIEIDDSRADQEFAQALANRNESFPITVTYASGETYQGVGNFMGEMSFNNLNTTMTCGLAGGGSMTAQ